MGHTSGNMEDSGAECNLMNCGGLSQDVTEEKNISVLPSNHSCDRLVKKVTVSLGCCHCTHQALYYIERPAH